MTKEEKEAKRIEKKRNKLKKILSKPNRPTAFIILFVISGLFLTALIGSIIADISILNSIGGGEQQADNAVEAVAVAFGEALVMVILFAMGVIVSIGLAIGFVGFLIGGIVAYKMYEKRKNLKLDYAVDDIDRLPDEVIKQLI